MLNIWLRYHYQPSIEEQFLIDCPITSEDITGHGAALLNKWAEPENGSKCVVSIAVEKNLYDGVCNPNAQAQSDSLYAAMRARGMDGVSSIRYDGECSGNEPEAPQEPEAPIEPEAPVGSYEASMSIYVQNAGDNVNFNGVSQSGYSNAESSHFNSSTNQFFLSNTYEGYFWNNNASLEQYAPNVGGLIQFDGKGVDCLISQINTSASGSLYTCSNDVEFTSGSELINVVFYKRTN
ncbi:hypothetical protein [Pseudomonas aeruginosa]|uniref:hypothetical protein n=1 Tax=Pseudomonas aeruginosa TaxID=287 RepID=UPI0010483E4B|nr:hypothetical protein [Pseudomonas aeruginosa]